MKYKKGDLIQIVKDDYNMGIPIGSTHTVVKTSKGLGDEPGVEIYIEDIEDIGYIQNGTDTVFMFNYEIKHANTHKIKERLKIK